MLLSTNHYSLGFGLAFMLVPASSTLASPYVLATDDYLPPTQDIRGCFLRYAADLDEIHALYNGGLYQLIDPAHFGFLDSFPPPPLNGSTTHSFGSTLSFRVSTDGGLTFNKLCAPGFVTVQVDSTGEVGNTRNFDTKMTQLDIGGGGLPPGVLIRESPTLASTGKTSIEDLGGTFKITSFFDIFTELSVDGGQTWLPDENGPAHVVLQCPEGGSALPLLAAPLLLLGFSQIRRPRVSVERMTKS